MADGEKYSDLPLSARLIIEMASFLSTTSVMLYLRQLGCQFFFDIQIQITYYLSSIRRD